VSVWALRGLPGRRSVTGTESSRRERDTIQNVT
jgi:hypothetical protein